MLNFYALYMQVPPIDQVDTSEGIKAAKSLEIPVYRLGVFSPKAGDLELDLVWRPDNFTEKTAEKTTKT